MLARYFLAARCAIRGSKGGVKVAVISRKGAVEQWKVPTSALKCELNLFVLFFPCCLVLRCKFAN